jgi:signal transduction histidine kinase
VKLSEDIRSGLRRHLPTELRNVSFGDRDWRISFSPMVVDKRSIGCVILFQDTTKEHMLERSRDEFFSIASHELRTPLTSIKGNSAMILDYYKQALKDEDMRAMLRDIHESSERLIGIVNDFLDVSRLEQGRIGYQIEELDLGEAVHEVAKDVGALFREKNLSLELAPGDWDKGALPKVIADKNRLKQVLFNLLGNAVKYTEHGGAMVSVMTTRSEVKILVQDTGLGISPKQRGLLFHKFQQAGDSILTRDTTRGTGLGLYISRLIAQGMGGNLVLAKSVPGKGSTFVVSLLIATPARLKRAEREERVVDLKSGLLVEP